MAGLWKRGKERESNYKSVTMAEVLDNYDIVDVADGTVIVVDRPKMREMEPTESKALVETLTAADAVELGSTNPSPFTGSLRGDYNPILRGHAGLLKFDEMRRSDATVRGSLRMIKTPVQAAHFFIEPASDKPKDKKIADFVSAALFEYATYSWVCVLDEALRMLDYGWYAFEKVWENRIIDGEMRTVLKKLAPRHPLDVQAWYYDLQGGPRFIRMQPSFGALGVDIPIDKLLVFTFDKEAGNMEGVSLLRSAYKHWYYKDQLYKIDAIQKERHGIGVPIIKLPPGFTPTDRNLAENMGRNLRTNDKAHIVLPPNWELMFAKLEGQPVDALKSAEHHDKEIEKNVLAPFMDKPVKDEMQNTFFKSTRVIADTITEAVNFYLIPQLVDFNFDVKASAYPQMRARRIGEWEDLRTMSFTLRNLVGAGIITPDEELERVMRKELDLPPVDKKTIRMQQTPQAAPGAPGGPTPPAPSPAGPPRQSPTPPVGTPRANAGKDNSGGK